MVDDLQSSEEAAFVVDSEVEPIIRACIEKNVAGQTYDEKRVQGWINAVCEDVMLGLSELKKPFKYVVTCMIMQNTGAGIHIEHASYCDIANDGLCTVQWPPDKGPKDQNTMYCIVTVYGFSF